MAQRVLFEVDVQYAKPIQAMMEVINTTIKLKEALKAVGEEGGKTAGKIGDVGTVTRKGKEETDKFSDSLVSLVGRYASVGTAIGIATKALMAYNAEIERGKGLVVDLAGVEMRLFAQPAFRGQEAAMKPILTQIAGIPRVTPTGQQVGYEQRYAETAQAFEAAAQYMPKLGKGARVQMVRMATEAAQVLVGTPAEMVESMARIQAGRPEYTMEQAFNFLYGMATGTPLGARIISHFGEPLWAATRAGVPLPLAGAMEAVAARIQTVRESKGTTGGIFQAITRDIQAMKREERGPQIRARRVLGLEGMTPAQILESIMGRKEFTLQEQQAMQIMFGEGREKIEAFRPLWGDVKAEEARLAGVIKQPPIIPGAVAAATMGKEAGEAAVVGRAEAGTKEFLRRQARRQKSVHDTLETQLQQILGKGRAGAASRGIALSEYWVRTQIAGQDPEHAAKEIMRTLGKGPSGLFGAWRPLMPGFEIPAEFQEPSGEGIPALPAPAENLMQPIKKIPAGETEVIKGMIFPSGGLSVLGKAAGGPLINMALRGLRGLSATYQPEGEGWLPRWIRETRERNLAERELPYGPLPVESGVEKRLDKLIDKTGAQGHKVTIHDENRRRGIEP